MLLHNKRILKMYYTMFRRVQVSPLIEYRAQLILELTRIVNSVHIKKIGILRPSNMIRSIIWQI